ncbi:MAG TPA: TetR/AcrR family transcriptional regulator [Pseudonocardia sp.]|nr:TetR/AcrR family transcriptional regulator [Pseudonocardia sp.]
MLDVGKEVVTPGRRRRRGEELRGAICRAVLEELEEHGFAAMTMDAVAARAGAGKATLYRHWSSKVQLVVAALEYSAPEIIVPPDSGDLRGEIHAVLRQIAADLVGPSGAAARGLIAEIVRSPELASAMKPFLADPTTPPMLEVLRRAAVRGEIPVAALTPRIAGVGTDLLRQCILIKGEIPEGVVEEILDQVVVPLLRGLALGGAPAS